MDLRYRRAHTVGTIRAVESAVAALAMSGPGAALHAHDIVAGVGVQNLAGDGAPEVTA